MHFSSGLCHLFVRMCTAITHTFFVYKKAGVNCNFTPTFGYVMTFLAFTFFCFLLNVIEVSYFYLFQLKAFQPILE